MSIRQLQLWALILVLANQASSSNRVVAEDFKWGDLQVRFVYDGTLPKPKKLLANRLPPGVQLTDESLLVNQKNRGVANVVAWLRAKRTYLPAVHPSFEKSSADQVDWTISGARLIPHVLAVRTSQTLIFQNKDGFGHGPKVDFFNNPAFGCLLPAASDRPYVFKFPESLPVKVGCNIHPWEGGWLMVQDHPYVGISDVDGNLEIASLPIGEWEFQFWHERCNLERVTEDDELNIWPKGRKSIAIKEGKNDLGTVGLRPKLSAN